MNLLVSEQYIDSIKHDATIEVMLWAFDSNSLQVLILKKELPNDKIPRNCLSDLLKILIRIIMDCGKFYTVGAS